MRTYISENGSQEGPYSDEQLEELFRAGAIPGDALYWLEGDENWLPIDEHPGFARVPAAPVRLPSPFTPSPLPGSAPARPTASAPPASFSACPVCGRAIDRSARNCPQCGHKLKRGYLEKLAIGGGVVIALFVVIGTAGVLLSRSGRRSSASESPAGPTRATRVPKPVGSSSWPDASPALSVARTETPQNGTVPPLALATPSPASKTTPAPRVLPSPRSVVADFYSWYLDEVRRGHSPWLGGGLSKRPEISHGFAVRLENAKEPEPGDDPIFTADEVPGSLEITDAKVNVFDATVAVRLGSGNTNRLVNVRLVRSDDSEPWQIDDVQPVLVGTAAPPATTDIQTGVATPGTAATTTPAADAGILERLLIGKWQGARHLTEYRPDHTRVMDGMATNPPRTWNLDGDQLSEEPGKNIYRVIALDQNQLVLEGDRGRRYIHRRVLNPAVSRAQSQPPDLISSARSTVQNFYNWYLYCDSRGVSPWRDGSLAQRGDVSHTFAVRSQTANEPEGEADPVLAGIHLPTQGSVMNAEAEGLVATVHVRLVMRDSPHDLNVRLARSTEDAPWQIDDVRPTSGATTVPASATRLAAASSPPPSSTTTKAVTTPVATPAVQLKTFEDEGHTCRLIVPDDGWIPVDFLRPGVRLALEGPGGIQLRVRATEGPVGDRSLGVMFDRAVREQFPFGDMEITPPKPNDHFIAGRRAVLQFSAQSHDPMQQMLHDMPDGPMKQGMLAGANGVGPTKYTFFSWTVVSEGTVAWIIELQDTISIESPAEVRKKTDDARSRIIRQFKLSRQFDGDPVGVYTYIRGRAVGTLEYALPRWLFDANGLTSVIDPIKQATDPEIVKTWSLLMNVQTW